jgi:formyl-CoA transferase
MWERLAGAIGASALLQRPEYETSSARLANRDALNADIEEHTVVHTSKHWIDRLNEAGVPCGPIYAIDEVFADPQVQHLGIARKTKNADGAPLQVVGQPVSLSRTPSESVAPPPKRGQHTDEVLKEFGFSSGEIDALRRANAI